MPPVPPMPPMPPESHPRSASESQSLELTYTIEHNGRQVEVPVQPYSRLAIQLGTQLGIPSTSLALQDDTGALVLCDGGYVLPPGRYTAVASNLPHDQGPDDHVQQHESETAVLEELIRYKRNLIAAKRAQAANMDAYRVAKEVAIANGTAPAPVGSGPGQLGPSLSLRMAVSASLLLVCLVSVSMAWMTVRPDGHISTHTHLNIGGYHRSANTKTLKVTGNMIVGVDGGLTSNYLLTGQLQSNFGFELITGGANNHFQWSTATDAGGAAILKRSAAGQLSTGTNDDFYFENDVYGHMTLRIGTNALYADGLNNRVGFGVQPVDTHLALHSTLAHTMDNGAMLDVREEMVVGSEAFFYLREHGKPLTINNDQGIYESEITAGCCQGPLEKWRSAENGLFALLGDDGIYSKSIFAWNMFYHHETNPCHFYVNAGQDSAYNSHYGVGIGGAAATNCEKDTWPNVGNYELGVLGDANIRERADFPEDFYANYVSAVSWGLRCKSDGRCHVNCLFCTSMGNLHVGGTTRITAGVTTNVPVLESTVTAFGQPPLFVPDSTKIAQLNVDMLDYCHINCFAFNWHVHPIGSIYRQGTGWCMVKRAGVPCGTLGLAQKSGSHSVRGSCSSTQDPFTGGNADDSVSGCSLRTYYCCT